MCQPNKDYIVYGGMMEPVKRSKALIEFTDEELEKLLQEKAETFFYNYENAYQEIRRRSQERNTTWMRRLTWAIVVLTALQVLVAFIGLFKSTNQ